MLMRLLLTAMTVTLTTACGAAGIVPVETASDAENPFKSGNSTPAGANPFKAGSSASATSADDGPLSDSAITQRLIKMGYENPSREDITRAREVLCHQPAAPVEDCSQVQGGGRRPGDSIETAIKVSARSLYEDHGSNHVRFREKYAGETWVKITGKVGGIGNGAIGLKELKPGIGIGLLAYASPFGDLIAADNEKGRDMVLSASVGKSITAICKMSEKVLSPGSAYEKVRYSFTSCQVA